VQSGGHLAGRDFAQRAEEQQLAHRHLDEDGTLLPPVGSDCEHPHPTEPPDNRIVTIIVGQHVKKGPNPMTVTHANLLRTIEDMYGVPPIGQSASVPPITGSLAVRCGSHFHIEFCARAGAQHRSQLPRR